jgi:hypothetical protein
MKGDRGKSGIKNYRSDHHEFRDFLWKFHNFWIKRAIKINWEKKIRAIRKLRFNQGLLRVQLGDNTSLGANWGQQIIETNLKWPA